MEASSSPAKRLSKLVEPLPVPAHLKPRVRTKRGPISGCNLIPLRLEFFPTHRETHEEKDAKISGLKTMVQELTSREGGASEMAETIVKLEKKIEFMEENRLTEFSGLIRQKELDNEVLESQVESFAWEIEEKDSVIADLKKKMDDFLMLKADVREVLKSENFGVKEDNTNRRDSVLANRNSTTLSISGLSTISEAGPSTPSTITPSIAESKRSSRIAPSVSGSFTPSLITPSVAGSLTDRPGKVVVNIQANNKQKMGWAKNLKAAFTKEKLELHGSPFDVMALTMRMDEFAAEYEKLVEEVPKLKNTISRLEDELEAKEEIQNLNVMLLRDYDEKLRALEGQRRV